MVSLLPNWLGHTQIRHSQLDGEVEVAFDGVQQSSRYPGGLALRFARVLRYRDDKGPDQADSIDTVRALHRS
jgi:ATP-dependent DNA ligase